MLKISRQAVHQYQRRQSVHKGQILELLPRIRALRQLMPRVGGRKLREHLSDLAIGRDKFFEILRQHGLLVKRRRRYTITTNSRHSLPVYPNLVPEATLDGPNEIWVADQTYIKLPRGFCYLSLVTDLWSRKIVGYDIASTLEATGPLAALQMALRGVPNPTGLIHHSDQGKQYCSTDYIQMLKDHGCRISMTAAGRPDQNATAERVNGILKTEFYLDAIFRSIEEARRAIQQSIMIYNTIRLHTSLGMTTPARKHAA
jgi:transposase InsO family protein